MPQFTAPHSFKASSTLFHDNSTVNFSPTSDLRSPASPDLVRPPIPGDASYCIAFFRSPV
ncbi:hypothetical protein Lser_V15G04933 [Lactuca serriola]